MRFIKFGMIACSVLLGIGIIGTGASLGKVYSSKEFVQVTELREELNAASLNNVYLKSDVPIRIETTQGQPYITFNNESIGITIPERTYDLKVREEGDSSYIEIKAGDTFLDMTLHDDDQEAVLYLPEKAMNKLEVVSNGHGWSDLTFKSKIDINELVLDVYHSELQLEGKYNKIDIGTVYGKMDIISHTPAEVNIHSNQNGGDLKLSGQYKAVNVDGGYNVINIDSETPYSIFLKGAQGEIKLKGNVEVAQVEVYGGDLTIDTDDIPKRIQIGADHTDVHINLPETLSGFEALYTSDYVQDQIIYSNFDVKTENIKENMKKITFGDGALGMLLDITEGELYILK